MLSAEDEYMLAKRWKEYDDSGAAQKLATPYLRLVVKVAKTYRGYGLPMADVISEGNIGLMHAIRKFDPGRGFRLSTYAIWWIKATIQEFVLRSWSIVRMGTTTNQKKLFFGLRRAKSEISALEDGDLHPDQVSSIASRIGVTGDEVIEMNRRMAGDGSLNAPLRHDEGGGAEWQDQLVDESVSAETAMADGQEAATRRNALQRALATLNGRERAIFEARRLRDDPAPLEELAGRYCVSRERIRQIEGRAFVKVQQAIMQRSTDLPAVPRTRVRARRQAAGGFSTDRPVEAVAA
ncbi:MAG: polymerase, sigma 32 subunit, RpoH, partial [Rhodospirillales bacterium]|nr:polymerase, sigma 32 subunit, RpoH [Rhodospirillales bacterium]